MTIKKQIDSGRKVIKLSATFFALVLVLIACKKEETGIGADLQNGNLNVIVQDTFTIKTYSEEIVEMESDETSVGLLGAYNDPVFGKVNCGFVTQIVPENLDPQFTDLGEFNMDSVVLALSYTSINYYANIEDIVVEVYEIDDVLTREDQDYYTSDTPTLIDASNNLVLDAIEGTEIKVDFVANSIVGADTLSPQLRINLDTEVGEGLITDALDGQMGSNFQTTTFKGLYVKVAVGGEAPGTGTVLYFNLEDILSRLTLYYTNGEGEAEEFDFRINTTTARYNKIDYDRTGTVVADALADQTLGEEAFYLQGGSVRGFIEFPHITDFYTNVDGEFEPKIINNAQLILPIQDFQTDPYDPATRIFLGRVEDEKKSVFILDYSFGTAVSGNTVTYDEENKEFRFLMTQEIQAILNGDLENVGYRVYASGFFASSIERIIFNGSNTSLKDRPRLEITYTEY
ncbi:MAG: DUF4270 family protein [Crocinitomix sp.]|nr:DUF4270 family protein [Crocinitomix sp.]